MREYYLKDGALAPGGKGLNMAPEQWRVLTDNLEVRQARCPRSACWGCWAFHAWHGMRVLGCPTLPAACRLALSKHTSARSQIFAPAAAAAAHHRPCMAHGKLAGPPTTPLQVLSSALAQKDDSQHVELGNNRRAGPSNYGGGYWGPQVLGVLKVGGTSLPTTTTITSSLSVDVAVLGHTPVHALNTDCRQPYPASTSPAQHSTPPLQGRSARARTLSAYTAWHATASGCTRHPHLERTCRVHIVSGVV